MGGGSELGSVWEGVVDWEPNTQGHMLGQVTPRTPKAAGFPCPSLSSQETQCSYSREIKSAVQVVPSCRWLKAGGLPSSRAVLGLSTGCCQWEQSLGVHEETPGRHFAMGSQVLFFLSFWELTPTSSDLYREHSAGVGH